MMSTCTTISVIIIINNGVYIGFIANSNIYIYIYNNYDVVNDTLTPDTAKDIISLKQHSVFLTASSQVNALPLLKLKTTNK